MLVRLVQEQVRNTVTARPTTMMFAVFALEDDTSITAGLKPQEPVTFAPEEQFITVALTVVQQRRVPMRQRHLITGEHDATSSTPVPGIPTARLPGNMCGTVITIFCVPGAVR